MINFDNRPKYFWRITAEGKIEKYHITKFGNHNQVKANPARTKPGRSSHWFDNDDTIFTNERQAKERLKEVLDDVKSTI